MSRSRRLGPRASAALLGLVFAVVIAGGSVAGIAYGFGVFSTARTVTATIPEAGPALGPGAEVQYRGVLVGSVGSVTRTLDSAVLHLDLDPSQVDKIPAGVTVRLMPRSVFGDLYVDLVPPSTYAGPLRPPAHLAADTSTPTVQLNEALDAGYRLLTAVQPAKLDATLTALATAVRGRGDKLGELVDQVERYTGDVAPQTGKLVHDIETVGTVSRELAHDAPDLLRTLDDAIATSQTIVASQPTLVKLLAGAPAVADRTAALLRTNRARLHRLVHLLHPVVELLAGHQGDLRRGVRQLRAFLLGAASALGLGPWLQVEIIPDVNAQDGRTYTSADCPRYPGMAGPNCPGQRSGGIAQLLLAPFYGAAATGASR